MGRTQNVAETKRTGGAWRARAVFLAAMLMVFGAVACESDGGAGSDTAGGVADGQDAAGEYTCPTVDDRYNPETELRDVPCTVPEYEFCHYLVRECEINGYGDMELRCDCDEEGGWRCDLNMHECPEDVSRADVVGPDVVGGAADAE